MDNAGNYTGVLEQGPFDGPVAVTVGEDGLMLRGSGSFAVQYARIRSFAVRNYRLWLDTEAGMLTVAMLGADLDPLYEALWQGYNQRTKQALFIEGTPKLATAGAFCFRDDGGEAEGEAKIELYDDCLCLLPPNAHARRVPFCFLRSFTLENYCFTLTLDTGETYRLLRLGHDTEPLFDGVQAARQALLRRSAEAVRSFGAPLTEGQTEALATLIPDGVAAPLAQLRAISPEFAAAMAAAVAASRAADAFGYFYGTLGDELCVGLKRGLGGVAADDESIVWLTALYPHAAAVELALPQADAAATYLYRCEGEGERFFSRLNHALEALAFHREVIAMDEGELQKPERDLAYIAVGRSGELQFLRSCFAGRAIHNSGWQATLDRLAAPR